MKLRDRIGIPVIWQQRLTWAMEISLVGMFFVGLYEQHVGIIINTGLGILVTQLPPLLRRDYEVPMDPALTLWITSAVFLHALGVIGLPGTGSFYRTVPGYDHITHVLSATVVAAVGYATARSFDLHDEDVVLPPRFMFVFILLFVMAFGVLWEVLEFSLDQLASMGGPHILSQHGLEDTMLDLIFDTIGAVVVAVWGTAYLTDVVGAVAAYFDTERATRGD
ncbi:MAG: hypothetical protein ABEI77_05760 [Halorientalis sp.]